MPDGGNELVPSGIVLVLTGALALAVTVRRSRAMANRDVAIALTTLMFTTLLLAVYALLGRDAPDSQRNVILTSVPALVLLVGMMLLRASTRQESQLRSSSRMWETLLEQSTDAVLTLDPALRIERANRAAEELFDRPATELVGTQLEALFRSPLTSWPALLGSWRTSLERGERLQAPEMLLSTSGGRELWLAASIVPLKDDGAMAGALLTLRDVTPLKEYERKRAEVDARGEMLLLLSHELRTPLTVIHGYAELLSQAQKGRIPHEGRYIESISSQATRLVEFVEKVLQNDGVPISRERLELNAFVEGAVERFSVSAGKHRISMLSGRSPVWVEVDTGLIEHVLHNLLTNATKYAPAGTDVTVQVQPGFGDAWVSVSDEGPGITSDERDRVFERCYRGENIGDVEGLGLGLFLARRAVEEHGGRIWVEQAEEGSTFTFSLPTAAAPVQQEREPTRLVGGART